MKETTVGQGSSIYRWDIGTEKVLFVFQIFLSRRKVSFSLRLLCYVLPTVLPTFFLSILERENQGTWFVKWRQRVFSYFLLLFYFCQKQIVFVDQSFSCLLLYMSTSWNVLFFPLSKRANVSQTSEIRTRAIKIELDGRGCESSALLTAVTIKSEKFGLNMTVLVASWLQFGFYQRDNKQMVWKSKESPVANRTQSHWPSWKHQYNDVAGQKRGREAI